MHGLPPIRFWRHCWGWELFEFTFLLTFSSLYMQVNIYTNWTLHKTIPPLASCSRKQGACFQNFAMPSLYKPRKRGILVAIWPKNLQWRNLYSMLPSSIFSLCIDCLFAVINITTKTVIGYVKNWCRRLH